MKRIFLLAMVFMLVLQVTAFAKVDKSATNQSLSLSSNYQASYQMKDKDGQYNCTILIILSRSYLADIFGTDENYYFRVSSFTDIQNKGTGLAFSKKNPVKLKVIKKDELSIIPFKKIYSISGGTAWYKIKKNDLNSTYSANKVVIVVPAQNKSIVEIEVPKEIVDEWQYIMTADMRKIKKEILGN